MPQGRLGERIPFEGVLNCWNDDHDLPDLLLAISRSGKTGRLHFSNPEGDKTLDLQDGKIVFAESSSQDDGLGQYLLRTGKISLMDYTRVAKLVQPGKRLGELLVEENVLAAADLRPAVIGQVRSVVLGYLLAVPRGRFRGCRLIRRAVEALAGTAVSGRRFSGDPRAW